jgi:hypothetical protein
MVCRQTVKAKLKLSLPQPLRARITCWPDLEVWMCIPLCIRLCHLDIRRYNFSFMRLEQTGGMGDIYINMFLVRSSSFIEEGIPAAWPSTQSNHCNPTSPISIRVMCLPGTTTVPTIVRSRRTASSSGCPRYSNVIAMTRLHACITLSERAPGQDGADVEGRTDVVDTAQLALEDSPVRDSDAEDPAHAGSYEGLAGGCSSSGLVYYGGHLAQSGLQMTEKLLG